MSVAPKSGNESMAMTVSWSVAPPGACENSGAPGDDDWGGTDHLEVHGAAGSTAPSSPSSATLVASPLPTATSATDWVHRSLSEFSYQLFACEDTGCSSYYDDGSGSLESAGSTTGTDSTEQEMWELTGITGEGDVGVVVVDDNDANAPHAFYYPGGWATGYSNKVALYYSKAGSDPGTRSEVYWKLHDDEGWPSDQTYLFNDSAYWDTEVLVAEGNEDDDTRADHLADHPWAFLTDDGTNKRVQLMLQSQGGDGGHERIVQIASSDEGGDDFGLCTSATSCPTEILDGGGYVAIDADGTSTTEYVVAARHSRIAWNYVEDPVVGTTDSPMLWFQLELPPAGTCADGTPAYDNIGLADGTWDSGSQEWVWDVDDDGTCAEDWVQDRHDNASIPLPDSEFKMYYQTYPGAGDYKVVYWNGTDWENEQDILIVWDGSATTGPTEDCIDNVSTFVMGVGGGEFEEAMFLRIRDSAICGTGLDDDTGATTDDGAIVFARHVN